MPFTLRHGLVFDQFRTKIETVGDIATVKCSKTGTFLVRFPGPIRVAAKAGYRTRIEIDDAVVEGPGSGGSSGKKFDVQDVNLPVTVRIESPDDREFTARQVTLQDLARFRDLQGVTRGLWTYRITGQSLPIAVGEGTSVTAASGTIAISSEEAIASQSAPPLVSSTITAVGALAFKFDLHRLGRFTASVRSRRLVTDFIKAWRGRLTLKDPDGAIVATSDRDRLTFDVTLPVLDKSRTPAGEVRQWTLEVVTLTAATGGSPITATVTTTARLAVGLLNDRIQTLLGENGANLSIFGENSDDKAKVKLEILNQLTAETVDMHDLLDDVVEGSPDIEANVAYTIASTDESSSGGRLIVSGLKVKTIAVSVGASQKITPPTPAIRAKVTTEGKIKVLFAGVSVATAALAGGSLELEAGLRLDANGSFIPETFFPEKAVDLDLDKAAYAAALVVTGGLGALGAAAFAERMESKANELIRDGVKRAVASMIARTPRILALFNGADFTYTSVRLDGDDILFDYTAPEEPTPKPSKNYTGVMGRSVSQLGPSAIRITPRDLGDTWARENLTKKIKNIVVVMMENRSFDHVLGYRAQLPGATSSDGLTQEILTAMAAEMVREKLAERTDTIPRLSQSRFQIKTQFPVPVGHDVIDVTEQLSARMDLPSKRSVNSPVGFVKNFLKKLKNPAHKDKAKPLDVLGFYEAADLPFFKFLAENYAYCEKYYCSHAGPTLPNRMFSLAGDLQFNRAGEAIIENNDSDDFLLSRTANIHDLLTRKGIGWRVYESFPSVTMLRMFARYAGDDTNIVPISRLDDDIAAGLPPLTVIEPAMHHFPPTDDHPVADMCNGQAFLRGIYDKLSQSKQWENTLLLITYDEHGGFYDHVIPPTADLRTRESDAVLGTDTNSGGPAAGGTPRPASLLTPYGVRVPTFVVSPWVRPGEGPDIVLDHCSILKTILACFCGDSQPFLSDRVHSSRSFESFLTEASPRLNVPRAPEISCAPAVDPKPSRGRIITPPISRKQMRTSHVDYHDLTGMLARMLGRK